ncbi:MAG: response regulator, partial [Lentisphaeria bacterium]|nr:response regulator [Lentisphaeria bacterium]
AGMEYVMRESTAMQAQAGEVLQALNEISAMHGLLGETEPYLAYLNNKLAELSVVPQKYASTLQMKSFENVQLDLNEVIMYNLRVCQKTFDPSITVEVAQNESNSWILADPISLSRALFCLLNNAAEALTEMRPEGDAQGGIISVSLEKIAGETIVSDKIMRFRHAVKEPPYWVIMISDTGVGIPESVLPNIFDMFFTTKNTDLHKGLGLSAAVNIINELGGFIDVNSKPGNGTVFKIYLPEMQENVEESDSGVFTNLAGDDSDIVYGEGTILHVSDDLFLRNITAKLMEKFGYTVISTDNGFEALDIYAQDINSDERHIQCVVSNLSGGIIRNLDFAGNLKQMNPEAAIAVLVNTEQDEEIEQLRELGIVDFITKPYSIVKISQVLAQYALHS